MMDLCISVERETFIRLEYTSAGALINLPNSYLHFRDCLCSINTDLDRRIGYISEKIDIPFYFKQSG